ncbi:uncharacterized protein N7506_006529 [Penicillium brevicompactum]|uniref:uncharacterized protein n=1 Tax=Penicillium brevicompactum TaxID=5074 RepID=UPI0025410F2C|nr:uncharacterized protein N7506_006529 [Penicillium brevicompactum]KAJ5332746.1 hypothetical protein N7506_006529 [Penicillium brevicompactum]
MKDSVIKSLLQSYGDTKGRKEKKRRASEREINHARVTKSPLPSSPTRRRMSICKSAISAAVKPSISSATLSKELGQQYAGLFTVIKRAERLANGLDLLPSWRVHDVISVHLEPAPQTTNPFNRETGEPKPTFDETFPHKTNCHVVP